MPVHYPRAVVELQVELDPAVATLKSPEAVIDPAQEELVHRDGSTVITLGPIAIGEEEVAQVDRNITASSAKWRKIVVPEAVEWTSNPMGETDTASVTLDWRTFPVDPRLVRRMDVTIYAGDIQHTVDGTIDELARAPFRRFVGIVHEPRTEHSESGSVLVFDCFDYSGRLQQARWDRTSIRTDRPVSQIMEEVLRRGVGGDGPLTVVVEPPDVDVRVSEIVGRTLWTPPQNASVWDVISGLARSVGLLATVDLDRLLIVRPTTAMDSPVRRLVYGSNIESLSYRRDLNPVGRKALRVRALDWRNRKVKEAVYPDPPGDREVLAFVLPPGDWPEDALKRMAESLYRAASLPEITGSLSTVAMLDAQGVGLMGLRAGDALEVTSQAGQVAGIALATLSEGEKADYIERVMGASPAVASRLADLWHRVDARLGNPFFVRRARHSLHRDDGYSVDVDFHNFLGV